MATRKHVHREEFNSTVDELFALLITPSSIRSWWGASRAIVLPKTDGMWTATWGESEDEPDYVTVANIVKFEPPRRLVLDQYRYQAKEGPLPFEADFVTEFLVDSCPTGASLQVTQDGFPIDPEADEFYEGCRTGWCATFEGIRKFIEGEQLDK